MDLTFVHIVFEVTADDPDALLPLLYDALRRFENFFKNASCSQAGFSCQSCSRERSASCPYRSVFGQVLSTDPDVVHRHQKPPLPFSFKIRELTSIGSCNELCIVIVGNAIQHLSVFMRAIDLTLSSIAENQEGDVAVSAAWCLDYQGERHNLNGSRNSLLLLSALEILASTQHADQVRIHLDSPLRLVSGGSITHFFDFGLLLRSQLRRCSSLFAYYGEGELELDYLSMSSAAASATSVGNSFRFAQPDWSKRANSAGIVGSGEFMNLGDGMLPLLKLGSYFNAGKGATYGMGAYRIEGLQLQGS